MESHLKTGRIGEEIACRYLLDQGFRILERNWRHLHEEVDIIAREGSEIVVVEVRTRTHSDYCSAVESVDIEKQYHLIHAINAYVAITGLEHFHIRFDIIGIDITPEKKYSLTHLRGAFVPCEQNKRLPHHSKGRPH